MFTQFVIPETVVSDNGHCFVDAEFEEFLSHNGIKHLKSASYHPASNGFAEGATEFQKRNDKYKSLKSHRLDCKSSV